MRACTGTSEATARSGGIGKIRGSRAVAEGMGRSRDRRPSDGATNGAGGGLVQRLPGKRTLVEARYGVQRRQTAQAPADDEALAAAAVGVAGPVTTLPFAERIQSAFGRHDVSGVQAHVGGAASEAAEAIGAEAYATGNHVAFRSAPDLHTAAHEAAHVVQQRAGVQLKGGVGAEGDTYERHADEVADAVVQGRSAEALLDRHVGGGGPGVQRKALQAADVESSTLDGTGDIFDSKIKTGLKFKITKEVAGATWEKAIAAYPTQPSGRWAPR